MPAYDFRCIECSHITEVRRAATDDAAVSCPECGGATKQVFHPVGVHFKGSGFHNTDNRRPAPAAETPPAACPSPGGPGCTGCPAAE